MNRLILKTLLFFVFSFLTVIAVQAQMISKNYDSDWKKVQELIDKDLPQSALTEARKIYIKARQEKQDAQVIKSLIFIYNLQTETRENNDVLSITELENEITVSREPVTSLLKSMLAGKYWQYFQQHRWILYDRTRTIQFDKKDIATWSAEDLHERISSLYLQSLANEKLLAQTRVETYEAIVTKGNTRHLRPTMYDLLAFEALEYFSSTERDIKKPAYAFEISQAEAFADATTFISFNFKSADTSSLELKALRIYQRLLKMHINDAKPAAFIDADIHRLEYVKDKSTHPDKQKLYIAALERIVARFPKVLEAQQAAYLVAAEYESMAAGYTAYGDSTHRYDRAVAKKILEKIVAQKDSSEGKINAINLLKSINAKSLQFTFEKVNSPGLPFRSLVKYKNISLLYLRLIKVNDELKKQLENTNDDIYWTSILKTASLREWQQQLPVTSDYQVHSAEIKIDGLPSGDYMLIASPGKDFENQKNIVGARMFYVSGIAFVNNQEHYFIVNRETGQPLPKATVQVWEQVYDYSSSKYKKQKGKAYTSDTHGYFKLERNTERNSYNNTPYLFDIRYNDDRLFMDDLMYDYYYYRNDDETPRTATNIFFFTDRSLYRPGQTLFFKGIVIRKDEDEKNSRVFENFKTTVYLRDANYQVVDSINLTTNEYGSFSGKFQLPSSGLTGQFSIFSKNTPAQEEFSVEEYKRPKFYVEYEPIKGTYRVNDNIKLSGFAKAYAGNNIDGATVTYRVVREPRFIYPWIRYRWWLPPAEPMEIAHGTVKTDEEGKFMISFTAIPDLKLDKKTEPVFDYKVYADVTDIGGETRSAETIVSVSYKSLMLENQVPERLPVDSLQSLSFLTRNMNGVYQKAQVTVTITKLKNEERLIRKRFWDRPDMFVMTKEQYVKNFPFDEYNNESDPHSWPKLQTVFTRTDSTRVNGRWPLVNFKPAPGHYLIEFVTKDDKGETVRDEAYIELYDPKAAQPASPAYLWTGIEKTTVEPGENATVELGSSATDIFLIQLEEHQKSKTNLTPRISFSELNHDSKKFSFPVSEKDRGGFGVSWAFIKNNRVYQLNESINVPWRNKDLKIEYSTFRDKTLPGSEEKWTVKISGDKNTKVAAEMLASMYDASLDQFYPHGWSTPSLWPSYYNVHTWNEIHNFSVVESSWRYPVLTDTDLTLDKRYDQLFLEEETNEVYGVRLMRMSKPVAMKSANGSVEASDADGVAANAQADSTARPPAPPKDEEKNQENNNGVAIRKNFNETAFFFPELRTDSAGNISFSFTLPEALTRWKFMALAHTKDAAFGSSTKEIITQKDLMVQPNAPRFLREGDIMEFSSKIVNMTGAELTGQAQLQLFDATTNQPVDGWFHNSVPVQFFTVAAGQSEVVRFPIEVPYQFNKALVWRVIATSGKFSDGEENAMPVLTNRMLVTESLPLWTRGNGTKEFNFPNLLNAQQSETLQHYGLTVQYTSNPSWYAVQALPYLMEYPYECAEQTWNRYYANSLAAYIVHSSPRIRQIFEQWKSKDTGALMSNLQKNQELKSVLLEETPWVLQGKSEAEQKKNIALLFDLVKMGQQLNEQLDKLKQMQSSNGGFVWFKGGPDDRYITQYIVTGIGHLKKLKAISPDHEKKINDILNKALPYLDNKNQEDYNNLLKNKSDLKQQNAGYFQAQYLYMRSFFTDRVVTPGTTTAFDYFTSQVKSYWTRFNKYAQGMIALYALRSNDKPLATEIMRSLKETSIVSEELGRYWKEVKSGWYWQDAPIETQSLMVELFEDAGDRNTADELRTWLLRNKQTNNWQTTKATAEACYALLLQGNNWTAENSVVTIKLGDMSIRSTDQSQEAGTGYFSTTIPAEKTNASMGHVSVNVTGATSSSAPAWGAVYWQYFEDLDKIKTAATPLSLVKKLFVEKNTDRGPVLTPVNEGDLVHVGDKIKVRIELRSDRDMQYVHMKDMRASAMEPVNVLSGYKYQGGLGYYEATRDASTNFFFGDLRKGTYVFEYSLFVTHTGNFSNGVTIIQCMYAPEFTSHSEGIRVRVE